MRSVSVAARLAVVIALYAARCKNTRNGRDLLRFKLEVIKYERFKLKDIFWIKCCLRNLKSL